MEEKKEIKISLTTLFLIIAIILIVIMGIYIFNLYKANQKSESSINELNTKMNALENSINKSKDEENIANTSNQSSSDNVINNSNESNNANYKIDGNYYEKNAQGDEPSYTFSENGKVTYGSLWMCNGTYTIDKNIVNIKFTSAEDPDGNKAKVKDFGVEESVKLTIVNENELKDSNGVIYKSKTQNKSVKYEFSSADNSAAKGNPEVLKVYELTKNELNFEYNSGFDFEKSTIDRNVEGSAKITSGKVYEYEENISNHKYKISFEFNSKEDTVKIVEYDNNKKISEVNLYR